MTLILQIFLLINILLIGALVTIALQHAMAHRRHRNYQAEPLISPYIPTDTVELPSDIKDRLLEASQAHFKSSLEHAADDLRKDLSETAVKLNQLLEQLGTEVMGTEMERYRNDLSQMRKAVETAFSGAESQVNEHQTQLMEEFKVKLEQEMSAEKQRLISQIDTKLGDAVASFLTEALQHNIDLGAQSAYLTALLEEHKAELKGEVTDETA